MKEYPPSANLDTRQELVSATAQFYCEETKCKKHPGKMAMNVFFLPQDAFIQQLKKERVDNDVSQEEQEGIEFTTKNKSQVFINETVVGGIGGQVRQTRPDIVRTLGKRDVDVVTVKSILIHAFGHVNISKELYYFDPFSLRVPKEVGPINFMQIGEGFNLVGLKSDGSPFVLSGADEAMTELNGKIIGGTKDAYLGLIGEYTNGANMLDAIIKKANISSQEFTQYVSGELPKKSFLQKVGALKNPSQPDEKAALLALATIALHVDDLTSRSEAERGVEEWLGIRLR